MHASHLFLSFEGRISRSTWWVASVILAVGGVVASSVLAVIPLVGWIGVPVVGLVYTWAFFALGAKRYHDHGISGWWQVLWVCIPVVGWLILLIRKGLLLGVSGHNAYGAHPAHASHVFETLDWSK